MGARGGLERGKMMKWEPGRHEKSGLVVSAEVLLAHVKTEKAGQV